MINIYDVSKVHLIGIGGVSMSAIAHIFLSRDIKVSGSDQCVSERISRLQNSGAEINIGHKADLIEDQDLIIYNGAIKKENPELIKAKELGIATLKRTEVISKFMKEHELSIAVSGTHGKTTTTTMITMILESCGENPSFMIGATVPKFTDTHRVNDSKYIVVEACEYQGSFLDFSPTTLIINNIEYEHVDFFEDLSHVINTFDNFAKKIDKDGYLIVNVDDKNTEQILLNKECNLKTYAIEKKADYMAKNLKINKNGCYGFDVYFENKFLIHLDLSVIGKFNVYNALGAIAAVHSNGVNISKAHEALSNFQNAERRFEKLGKYKNATIVSDYAHHPSEIKATLESAKKSGYEKVVVAFQPHTYSRTKNMMKELGKAFTGVDRVFVTNIYAARENNIYKVHSRDLTEEISKNSVFATYIGETYAIEKSIEPYSNENSLIIIMGAGDIDSEGRHIANLKK